MLYNRVDKFPRPHVKYLGRVLRLSSDFGSEFNLCVFSDRYTFSSLDRTKK